MKKIIIILGFLIIALSLSAQNNLIQGEYFFDTDPGFGNGTPLSFTQNDTVNLDFNVNISSLSCGFHNLFVRFKDTANRWSIYESVTFFVESVGNPTQLVQGEYFFDTDPGFGNATPLTFTANDTLDLNLNINTSSLSNGFHNVFIRFRNSKGLWGLYDSYTIYNEGLVTSTHITELEYFFDNDPGFGNGTPINISSNDTLDLNLNISTSGLSNGFHNVFYRAKDNRNIWSIYESYTIYIEGKGKSTQISEIEYFIDNDPGFGNGISIPITQADTIDNIYNEIISGITEGYHRIYIRTKDNTGRWSIFDGLHFEIDSCTRPAPPTTPIGDTNVCYNIVDYQYRIDTAVFADVYQWKLEPAEAGTIVVTDTLATINWSSTYVGDAELSVRAYNDCDTSGYCEPLLIHIYPLPTTTVTSYGNLSFCPGSNVDLVAYNGLGFTYRWFNTGTLIPNATNSLFTATLSGDYTTEITTYYGCVDTSTATTITVYTLPSASITSSGPTSFCMGASVTLNANTGAGLSYIWKKNGNVISGQIGASILVTDAGTYLVEITNSNNCSTVSSPINISVNPIPNAAITPGGATTFCQGGILALNATLGSGYTYEWLNNGSTVTGVTTSAYNVSQSGSYQVVITSTNQCSDTSSAQAIIVKPIPSATITASGPTSFCLGGSVTLNANTGTGLSYIWKKNGNIMTGETGASILVTDAGTYLVEITNSNSCTSVSSPINISVNPIPNAAITPGGATTFCQGGIVILNGTLGSGYTYEWLNNGSTVSGVTSSVYNVSQSGSYKVVITSTNQCSDTSSAQTVTVNPIPSATITASGPTSFCIGGSVTLNTTTGTGLTYIWKKNGNVISGQTSSSIVVSDAGNYLVEISNSYSCTTVSNIIVVAVNPIPNATITVGGASTICQGDVLQLYGTSGTGYSYQWLNNGSPISGSTALFHTITQSGSYQVVVTSASLCSDTSSVQAVTVNPAPTSAFSLVGSSVFCQGDSVLLDAVGSTGNTYQWKSYGINIPSASDSFHYVYQTGNFSLVTSNSYNCSTESSAQQITVNTSPGASILPLSSTTFCYGDSVKLQANIGTGLTYQWFKNSVLLSGATSSQFVVYNSGAYTVEVSNAANCSSLSAAANVTVYAVPTASFSMQSIACKSDTVTITYNGTGSSGAFYNWNFHGGIVTSGTGQGPFKVIWNSAGFKNVSLSVNENGCVSPLISHTIEIKSITANITAPNTTVCAGDSVFLYANSGQNLTYQWYQGGLPVVGETNAYMAATTSGLYKVLVTNSVVGCSQFSSNIQVNVYPTNFNLDFAATPTSFSQPPFNVVFTNSTPNMNNYLFLWDFGDATSSSFYQPFHQYLYNGNYTVSLYAENSITGCRDTLVKTSYVSCAGGAPNPCNITAAITPAGPATICFNDSIMLTASSGTNYTYQWTYNGVILPGADSIIFYAKHNGTYRVIITDPLCSQTSPPFVLNHYPSVLPIIQVNGAILPCTNDSLELLLGSYYNNYLWSTNETSNSIWVSQTGYYTVTVTDNYNCVIPSPVYTVNTSFLQPPEVCIVGVDTNNHNRVIWEKPPTTLIDSFFIYREGTITGQYDKIGTLPYNAPGIFSDINSNPQVRAYRYKLAAKDTCGGQTLLSDYHKSIHLTINAGLNGAWNLIWDGYVGFPFGSYIIYRGVTTSNMTLLTQLPSTLSSYTDLNPPTGTIYYQIEV
ncbi:MAG: PKD domain-containing protein, partial [Saprospiraceae bacterium]|nr:PKD domain-containing protein [Saprospiraceae bacterium]